MRKRFSILAAVCVALLLVLGVTVQGSVLASCGHQGPFRAGQSSLARQEDIPMHRSFTRAPGYYPPLWDPLQNRTVLQASCAPDRNVWLSLLDALHETAIPQEREHLPPQGNKEIPGTRGAQDSRLPLLYPNRRHCPRHPAATLCYAYSLRLEVIPVLDAHNKTGNPAFRMGCGYSIATQPA